jgi:hypothetical protein
MILASHLQVYFQSWWDTYCPTRNCSQSPYMNPEELLIALKQHHRSLNLPVGITQLDTWWFYQQADAFKGGDLDCIDWVPRADMFPHGLPYVTQQEGGIPLLLYAWGWSPISESNRMTNWTWETSQKIGSTGDDREGMVALDEVYAFYSMIRDRFLAYNGTSFEEDNMGLQTMYYPSHTTAVDGVERWWQGFASPWCESQIPVQICESSPADILESLKFSAVTNSRDNIDDVPGNQFPHRWHVGFDRMFLAALAIQPFYDNTWSSSSMPNSSWAPATEDYVELAWVISVLSAGPVGFGDEIGYSNASLIMTCCSTDGTILKASTPSTYLNLVYLPQSISPIDPNVARVFEAPSFIPGGPAFTSVLAVDLNNTLTLLPSYLTPDLSATEYVAVPWSRGFAATDALCASNAPAAGCVLPFSPSAPLTVSTGLPANNNSHNFELYSLSPVSATGWSLLGELHKVVHVSVQRFASVTYAPSQMTVVVNGAPGESVDVAFLAPPASEAGSAAVAGTILRYSVPMPASGGNAWQSVTVSCTGVGAASACTW